MKNPDLCGTKSFKTPSSVNFGTKVESSLTDIVHTANKIKEDDGTDIQDLFTYASTLVKFRLLSMPSLLKNGGVLHSKLLLVDRMHFYLGSANLSDRGLNQR